MANTYFWDDFNEKQKNLLKETTRNFMADTKMKLNKTEYYDFIKVVAFSLRNNVFDKIKPFIKEDVNIAQLDQLARFCSDKVLYSQWDNTKIEDVAQKNEKEIFQIRYGMINGYHTNDFFKNLNEEQLKGLINICSGVIGNANNVNIADYKQVHDFIDIINDERAKATITDGQYSQIANLIVDAGLTKEELFYVESGPLTKASVKGVIEAKEEELINKMSDYSLEDVIDDATPSDINFDDLAVFGFAVGEEH